MIVEIMGRPPEHLSESLKKHIGLLDKVKGVKVVNKTFSDPKIAAEEKDLYTCFSEIEFECQNLKQLADVMFDFMPSSVEVVDPANVSLAADEATSLLNNLTGRLHRYDEVAQTIQNKEKQMMNQFKMAQQLLLGHGIIDKKGKVLKLTEEMKKAVEEAKKKAKEEKSENKEKTDVPNKKEAPEGALSSDDKSKE